MKKIIIDGGRKLTGKINISGAKNSLVALIPAAILSDDIAEIYNVPNISDKHALLEILDYLKVDVVDIHSKLIISTKKMQNKEINEYFSKKLRASYYFMGALLAKYKRAEVHIPGGCKIGKRPIDLHIMGFEKMGAVVRVEEEKYIIEAENLHGADIEFSFPSVGATINIMLAASKAKGITTIKNAAKEVEIINIGNFLISMGCKITGLGTSEITIEGINELKKGKISVIPDRIEAGTYVILGALLGENLLIEGFIKEYNEALIEQLDKMGVNFSINKDSILLNKVENIKPTNVVSGAYPEFPTDLGQPMQLLLTQATGKSTFKETIYENRMGHIKYLNKMGASIIVKNNEAIFDGPTKLKGDIITAVDLRGGAALVIAGLLANGTTVINDVDHILRGYENIIYKLTEVGAIIRIEEI